MTDDALELEVASFEAHCETCGHAFSHPSFGPFSYGLFLFCTEDGKRYVYFNAIGAIGEQLTAKFGSLNDGTLAQLADSVDGQKLTSGIHCPKCGSCKLVYWEGKSTGTVRLGSATYRAALSVQGRD
jgi:DNA-directed RNA polymerase subunit RPC12/RpoP